MRRPTYDEPVRRVTLKLACAGALLASVSRSRRVVSAPPLSAFPADAAVAIVIPVLMRPLPFPGF